MGRKKLSSSAQAKYAADAALAAMFDPLLAYARTVENAFRKAQAAAVPNDELYTLAWKLDAAITDVMRAAYAAARAEIGPRGYDDRIYCRKAKAKPAVRAWTDKAEWLLTLRETHRLTGIPRIAKAGAQGASCTQLSHQGGGGLMAEAVRQQRTEPSKDAQRACECDRAVAVAERPDLPAWWRPVPFGHPAAIQSLSSIAAPLLAGFSITLIGVVAQAPEEFRWPGVTMTVLAAAASVLIWCVQCGFWARQYAASRADVYDWFGDFKNDPDLEADIQDEQIKGGKLYHGWERRTRRCYAAGILLLTAGVATCVAPPNPVKNSAATVAQPFWRWVGVGIIATAFFFELLWNLAQSKFVQKHCKWLHNLLAIFVTPRVKINR